MSNVESAHSGKPDACRERDFGVGESRMGEEPPEFTLLVPATARTPHREQTARLLDEGDVFTLPAPLGEVGLDASSWAGSTMVWHQTAFDLDSAGVLNDDRRPAVLGWSHAAIGDGQVSGPVHAQTYSPGSGKVTVSETGSRAITRPGAEMTGRGIRDGIEGPRGIRPHGCK